MDTTDGSLERQLEPWFNCFASGRVTWGTVASANASGRCYGVVVEFPVNPTSCPLDEQGTYNLELLREAIDLVRLLLVVRPSIVAQEARAPERKLRFDTVEYEAHSNRDAWEALARGVPAELRVPFFVDSIHTRALAHQLVVWFTQELSQPFSSDTMYLSLRQELLDQIDDHDALSPPVVVTLEFNTAYINDFSVIEAEDFFVGLAEIARELRLEESRLKSRNWAKDSRHAPLRVDKIEITLERLLITHEVVKAAQAFVDVGFPVDCKVLNLDLRQISCTQEDLLQFVSAVTQGATRLRIRTGFNVVGASQVDDHGEDRREKLEVILCAIDSVEHVHDVDLGGLLALCRHTTNCELILRRMVETILSRKRPLHSLTIGDRVSFTDRDSQFVERVATEFRAAHLDIKLRVKHLQLSLLACESTKALTRFVSVLDDAERVSIAIYDPSSAIPTEALRSILRFPSLRRLKLDEVSIVSMDLFDPSIHDPEIPCKPALEELTLHEVRLEDVSSVQRFVSKLKSPSDNVLATSLRRFHLRARYPQPTSADQFFNHDTLLALDVVLRINRVLSDVGVYIHVTDEEAVDDELRLRSHQGRTLPVVHALRRVREVKARNLAFFSVIQDGVCDTESARLGLDTNLISLIFDFSAPHVPRTIEIITDNDSDSD